MEFGVGPSVDLLSVILFLLPGFGGIKLGLRIAERGDWLNRLETTALSFALSLVSMLALYIGGTVYRGFIDGKWEWLSQTTVETWLSPLPSVISFYLLLVAISFLGGTLLGIVDFGANYLSPILPWARFHELAKQSGQEETYIVRVKTSGGDELLGKVEDEGEAALNKDIVLENPRRLRFDESGDPADDSYWTGYAYIHSQSIAYVVFDRLDDADATEAAKRRREGQKTIQELSSDENKGEMDELEKLAEEANKELEDD